MNFNSVRTITDCDCLELCQRLQHAEVINSIVAKHPTWKIIHGKRLIDHNDATSQIDWTGELEVNDIEFYQQWVLGRGDACSVLNVNQSFFSTAAGYSMLRPNKRVVGVTIDLEREEDAVLDEETSIPADILEENEVSLEEMKRFLKIILQHLILL